MKESISVEDFIKAKEALEKANVPGPYRVVVNTDEWTEEQWQICSHLLDCDEKWKLWQCLESEKETMEEMAGPKEEHGKRQPGEKCMYEKHEHLWSSTGV
jgi:hypothetical protein